MDYKPSPISPTTYKIPPKQYIYVIGGTTHDAYRNVNVNNSANKGIKIFCYKLLKLINNNKISRISILKQARFL